MATRGRPAYEMREVAEVVVESSTHVRVTLDCSHSFLFNPRLPGGQSIEDWAEAMQRYIGQPWRCKSCVTTHAAARSERTHPNE